MQNQIEVFTFVFQPYSISCRIVMWRSYMEAIERYLNANFAKSANW